MHLLIETKYGLTTEAIVHTNIKKIKIIPTIPYCSIAFTTYKNPNHTSSIPLFNETQITITPELDDKIYPKLKNK